MKKDIDDIFLLQRIIEDDQTAFKYLFETYFTSIYRFLFLSVKDREAVEEIALDVFTAFWEKRKTIEIKISIKAYLFQSARNRMLNYIRDEQRTITTACNDSGELFEETNYLEIKELETLIEEAICSLPEKGRDIFRKSRVENLTNKEIAAQLQISTKGVEAQITRALKHIRQYLGTRYTYLW